MMNLDPVMVKGIYLPLTQTPVVGNYCNPQTITTSRYAIVDAGFYPETKYCTFVIDPLYSENTNDLFNVWIEMMI